jgi:hypothetical protein
MPVSYQIDSGILTVLAAGVYAPEDVPRTFLAALADPACPDPVGLLLDVRKSEVLSTRTAEQIRVVAEFLKPYAERIRRRCAVVVTLDAHYGLGRMGAVFAQGIGVEAQVFRSPQEARGWLESKPTA